MRRSDSNGRPPGYEPGELPTAPLRDVVFSVQQVLFPVCDCKVTDYCRSIQAIGMNFRFFLSFPCYYDTYSLQTRRKHAVSHCFPPSSGALWIGPYFHVFLQSRAHRGVKTYILTKEKQTKSPHALLRRGRESMRCQTENYPLTFFMCAMSSSTLLE